MKTPPFLLIGCPIIVVVAALLYALTYPALHRTAFHAALIDAEAPASADDGATGPTGDTLYRAARMRRAFQQLGLSTAQKQQISQIRATITDRQQRRDAIMNALTPEQRAKWQQIRDASRNGAPAPAPAVTNAP